jgi:hypothetical protein
MMRAFCPIFSALAACALLTDQVAGDPWTAAVPAIEAGYSVHGEGGLQGSLLGYGYSAYSEKACMAPEYGMEDVGSHCDHWRNTCCDNAWAGYCGERGLLGRRTSRSSDCNQQACCPGGSRLFSLFRWSQPASGCAASDGCCTEGASGSDQEAAPLEPAPEVAPVEAAGHGNTRISIESS